MPNLNKKMQEALNDQINKELYSSYLYWAMKSYFINLNLDGFANWLDIQVKEEYAHAMGIYDYILSLDGEVTALAIDKPEFKDDSILSIFKQILEHEKKVTASIHALADLADELKDRNTTLFLNWYVKEQIEEEASVKKIISTLEMIGNDKNSLLDLDKELAQRVFNQPVIF